MLERCVPTGSASASESQADPKGNVNKFQKT